MTTEYYQIPSQQGLLPLDHSSPDPWLAAATATFSSLSLDSWKKQNNKNTNNTNNVLKPLFEPGEMESTWNQVVPMQNAGMNNNREVKAPKVPKTFYATSSKIDAWSVVDTTDMTIKSPQTKRNTKPPSPSPQAPLSPAEDRPSEDDLSNQNRYKTELCKSFTETGVCRYGTKCQFAHGKEEIRPILRHPKYKTEICKTFHTTGTCPYGIRCRFIHTRSKEESLVQVVKVPQVPFADLEEDSGDDDEIVSLKHPPGIPVPKWSQSWNMTLGSAITGPSSILADHLAEPEPAF